MLFSITMLSKIHYYGDFDEKYDSNIDSTNISNITNNDDEFPITFNYLKNKLCIISAFEICVVIWVFALFIEEFNQVNQILIFKRKNNDKKLLF